MIIHRCKQGTPEWTALRIGIPTASEFDRILTPKTRKPSSQADGYMHQKLAEWSLGEPTDAAASQYMTRGSELEAEGRAWYEFEYGVRVDQVGFITNDAGTIGASPDGLIGDEGLIEIKCLAAVNHVAALLGDADDYVLQVQGQLWISGRKWCDRCYYHPTIKPFVERVECDEECIGQLAAAVEAFNVRLDEAKKRLLAMKCQPKGVTR
jgi:hypothetical protein